MTDLKIGEETQQIDNEIETGYVECKQKPKS